MPNADWGKQLSVLRADITTVDADVIVNAANSLLSGGGGVDGAIHAAAGPTVLRECQEIFRQNGPCETGAAVITNGGQLRATWIVHTVGPIWELHEPTEAKRLLTSCYSNSLEMAASVNASTVAFSAISTGVYGFPKDLAAPVAVSAVASWLQAKGPTRSVQHVTLVCFDETNFELTKLATAATGLDIE